MLLLGLYKAAGVVIPADAGLGSTKGKPPVLLLGVYKVADVFIPADAGLGQGSKGANAGDTVAAGKVNFAADDPPAAPAALGATPSAASAALAATPSAEALGATPSAADPETDAAPAGVTQKACADL